MNKVREVIAYKHYFEEFKELISQTHPTIHGVSCSLSQSSIHTKTWLISNILFQMTSVERIQQYKKLDQEAPEHTELVTPSGWPAKGEIHFDHVMGLQILNQRHQSYSRDPSLTLFVSEGKSFHFSFPYLIRYRNT